MKLYLKTICQSREIKYLFRHFTNMEPVALQLVCNKDNLTLVNSALKTRHIIDTTNRTLIAELRKRKWYGPDVWLDVWRRIVIEFYDSIAGSSPVPEIEVVGYNAAGDFNIFKYIMNLSGPVPPDTFMRRVVFRDLADDLNELANTIPDENFSMESAFSLTLIKSPDQRYKLSEKVKMILSHRDCPDEYGAGASLLDRTTYLAELDNFITNVKF